MLETHGITIASQAGVTPRQVKAVRSLIDAGATVPFFIKSQYTTLRTSDSLAHQGDEIIYGQALFGFGHESAFVSESNLRAV